MNGIQKIAKNNLGQDLDKGILVLKGLNHNHPSENDFKLMVENGLMNAYVNDGSIWQKMGGLGFLEKASGDGSYVIINSGNTVTGENSFILGGKELTLTTNNTLLSDVLEAQKGIVLRDAGAPIILHSPDGTEYSVTVDNSGNLVVV